MRIKISEGEMRQYRKSKRDLTPVKPTGLRQGLKVPTGLEINTSFWESKQTRKNSH